ncbi:MAG: GNAT family N-acetyltransferase [Opitutaceae bacterium]
MTHRPALLSDVPLLAALNQQLIRDDGHRNRMTVAELGTRMHGWLESGEYGATIFEAGAEVVAYALHREQVAEIYLRQFFVVRHRRREGVGRGAMRILLEEVWPRNKRLTVEVLSANLTALSFYRALGYGDYAVTLEIFPAAGGVL